MSKAVDLGENPALESLFEHHLPAGTRIELGNGLSLTVCRSCSGTVRGWVVLGTRRVAGSFLRMAYLAGSPCVVFRQAEDQWAPQDVSGAIVKNPRCFPSGTRILEALAGELRQSETEVGEMLKALYTGGPQ